MTDDLLAKLAAGLQDAARAPNVYSYRPNEGAQSSFHRSEANGRLLIGSNRSGKTHGGVTEDVWWATGTHPFLKTPKPPTYGRIITVDADRGIDEIILPKLRQFIPRSFLRNGNFDDSYEKRKHKLTLINGSTIEIMTHGQDLDSFAGTSRHWLHVDEECPKAIFNESKARLLDYNGRWWITMTPVEGITWIDDDLIEKKSPTVAVFWIDVKDNKHISQEAIATLAEGLDDIEKKIRIEGKMLARGGVVFTNFVYEKHVIDVGVPAKQWEWWVSVDSGFRNETAIYWHAVTENGIVLTFFEHYKSGWTVAQDVEKIREVNKQLGKDPYMYVGDPSMSQRSKLTGGSLLDEYRKLGISIIPGKKNVPVGLDKMNEYFRQNRWYITKNCPNLIRAVRKKYSWKTHQSVKTADRVNPPEQPQKKDDHGPDSCRYFFSYMKTLNKNNEPLPVQTGLTISLTETNPKDFPWRIDRGTFNQGMVDITANLGFGEIP